MRPKSPSLNEGSLEGRDDSSAKKMKLEAPAWIGVAAVGASILVAIFNKWWDPIAAHVGYPFGVDRRVEELGRKVQSLSDKQSDLRSGDPLPSSAERIRWLKSVDDLQKEEKRIKDELVDCGLSYFKRCYIGNKADTELKKANDLISQGDILLPEVKARPHPVRHVQSQELRDPLPGMKVSCEKVLHFIKDNNAQSVLLGIWGMGGVGKTTLISQVRDSRSKYHDDFVEVLFVHAGKRCTTVADLQKAIAISISLPQIGVQTSQADIIHNHLKDKSFLLLLDDLWEFLDLGEVGIPLHNEQDSPRRKVVFTTRSMYVCTAMDCRRPEDIIQMKCLSKEDAWNLFAQKVGNKIFDDKEIHELAKLIAQECSGLPMALCKIGKIMSAFQDPKEWRATRDRLKKSNIHEVTGSDADLLRRLKESYDNMTDEMKERFLLCSLWPENDNISMKKLIRWWIGLGLLDVSNASDMGYTHINSLVHASMLEKGDTGPNSAENSHVKMHNIIRMMALWIVNEHGYENKWLPNSLYRSALAEEKWRTVEKAWVSQEDTTRWRNWSAISFPQLNMLVARHVFSLKSIIYHFKKITFLDLEGTSIDQFPSEICELAELQHLNLSGTAFDVLPLELKKLSKLKYLYIRKNTGLRIIPAGLLLDLKRLQGLDFFGTGACFSKVQYTYSLLEELTRPTVDLHMLGFTVQTIAEIKKLGQLKKRVCTQALCMHHFEDNSDLAIMNLQFLSELTKLRELAIVESFHSQKVLIAEGDGPNYGQWLLPYLEIFKLNNLLKLEKVTWKNTGVNMRVVSIYKCDKLKNVTWVRYLGRLEQLTVAHCNEIEILIEAGEWAQGVGMTQTATISFPRLKKLKLEELPKLSMICKQPCEFEELTYICIARCNEMKDIKHQNYNQSMIKIDCSEDWWTRNSSGRLIPSLFPTFCF